jgi:hypothetical protein
MNRHERRRAEKKARENKFYNEYVRHLPPVAQDAPYESGRIYHTVMMHDDWCAIYSGKGCNCNPIITRHIEPKRS